MIKLSYLIPNILSSYLRYTRSSIRINHSAKFSKTKNPDRSVRVFNVAPPLLLRSIRIAELGLPRFRCAPLGMNFSPNRFKLKIPLSRDVVVPPGLEPGTT